jgi:hypothetical protein
VREVFDLTLSAGVIDETIREAGRASLPLEDALVATRGDPMSPLCVFST